MKLEAKKKPQINGDTPSSLYWFMLLTASAFFVYAPFRTALFNGYSKQYDGPIFNSILTSSVILILLAIHFMFKWNLSDHRDLLGVYVWLIPLTYWISSLTAASSELAKNMALIHVSYATLFIFGAYLARNKLGAKLIQGSITFIGYGIVLFGLACAFGNLYSQDAVMLTVDGYRLTSVFQYANAYAAYLITVLLCSLYYITHSKKWYIVFVHSLMLVPTLVSFWLTLSRGGIVILPFIFLAILPLLKITRQLAFSLYTIIAIGTSFILTNFVTQKSTSIVTEVLKTTSADLKSAKTYNWFHIESIKGWSAILLISLITSGILLMIHIYVIPWFEHRLSKFTLRRFSRLVIPVTLILIAVLGALIVLGTPVKTILPQDLQTRLENINFEQNSVLERGTFYKDSLKVFKDHSIIGAGGGGWAALYQRYQNNPYTSYQAHNFFLQYLIEVGAIGITILIIFLIAVYLLFIRKSFSQGNDELHSHFIFYFVSISILLHSMLDFEMSYVFLGALVFLCLGGMASVLDGKPAWFGKLSFFAKRRIIYPCVISGVALVFFIISLINVTSDNSFDKAIAYANQGKPLNEILVPLDKAIRSSSRSEYYNLKANFLIQVYAQNKNEEYWNQAKDILEKARKKEPNNRLLLERQYALFLTKQDLEAAVNVVNEGLEKYPWELSFYERAGSLYNAQWNQARQQNNTEIMEQKWKLLQANYQAIQDGIDYISKLPDGQVQGRAFYLSSIIRYSVGQVYMVNGQYDKALPEMQFAAGEANSKLISGTLQQGEDEQYKPIIRWYLALTQKQGTTDQAFYNAFIKKYDTEKQQIEAILGSLK